MSEIYKMIEEPEYKGQFWKWQMDDKFTIVQIVDDCRTGKIICYNDTEEFVEDDEYGIIIE